MTCLGDNDGASQDCINKSSEYCISGVSNRSPHTESLSSFDTDQVLIKGAVCTDLETVSRKFSLENQTICSPVVEYQTETNYHFLRPVRIYLPHFLEPDFNPEDVKCYMFHNGENGSINLQTMTQLKADANDGNLENDEYEDKFAQLDEQSRNAGTFYFSPEGRIVILTLHFTGFFCTRCGKEYEGPLHLELRLYGSQMTPSTRDIYLKLVIWDRKLCIQDFFKV